MQFNEVIGHDAEKAQLRELVQRNRLSHSLLFLGPEGSGALPLALAFAQYILCERVHPPKATLAAPDLFGDTPATEGGVIDRNDSCGACPACIKASQYVHPDLHFSYPVLKRDSRHERVLSTDYASEWRQFLQEQPYGNAADWLEFLKQSPTAKIDNPGNKQGNISVQECEDILHKLSLRPYESDFKVLIMWMPEFLGKEGNRLLKLIEEPPPGTIFIFVAEDDSEILPTILSRTQLIKIPLPEDGEVVEYLLSKNVEPVQATRLASIAAGNLREAFRMSTTQDNDWLAAIRLWLNVIYENNVAKQTKWIDEINLSGRGNQKEMLNYLLHLIGLAIKTKFLTNEQLRTLDDAEIEFAHTLSKMCEVEILEEMSEEVGKGIYYIERNANSKLLFHALTIRLFHLIKQKQVILMH